MTDKTEAVQRMQDYISVHLTEDISLSELAEAAHFSPWYSLRLFKELTGGNPCGLCQAIETFKICVVAYR